MTIPFAQLRFAEPSPEARRLLWHVPSIGTVWQDEPERHEGLDKSGLFLCWSRTMLCSLANEFAFID